MSKNTKTYTLYHYDLWGNEEDGYEVNDIQVDATDEDILYMLNLKSDHEVEWNGLETYYITDANGSPVCELIAE
jgi:hypothetical protein